MARIRLQTGEEHSLSPRHVVGRAPACQLQLHDPRVSAFHAELIWDGRGWTIQDLGSRNGTRVDDTRLTAGEAVALARDSKVTLAASSSFRLIDDSAPHLIAVTPDGELREAEDDLLLLPNDEEPELTIYRAADERWMVESAAGTKLADEREPLFAGGRPWRLMLPSSLPETRELDLARALSQTELRFAVSRDGEHVQLSLAAPAGEPHTKLEPRAHLALLLVLARERLRDGSRPDLPPSEHGWVDRDQLPKMLGVQSDLVNLWTHRARRQLARAGVRDAAALIQRRASDTQLRIGTAHLAIDDT